MNNFFLQLLINIGHNVLLNGRSFIIDGTSVGRIGLGSGKGVPKLANLAFLPSHL